MCCVGVSVVFTCLLYYRDNQHVIDVGIEPSTQEQEGYSFEMLAMKQSWTQQLQNR